LTFLSAIKQELKVEEFSGYFDIPFRCSRIHLGKKNLLICAFKQVHQFIIILFDKVCL
jgi:hypothetical protein